MSAKKRNVQCNISTERASVPCEESDTQFYWSGHLSQLNRWAGTWGCESSDPAVSSWETKIQKTFAFTKSSRKERSSEMRVKWRSKLVGFETTKIEAIESSHEMLVRGGAPTDMLRAFKLNERVHQAWLRCVGCVLLFCREIATEVLSC